MKFLKLYDVMRLRAGEWYVPGTYVYINASSILAINDISLNIGGVKRPVCCISVGGTDEEGITFYVAHETKALLEAMNAVSVDVAITECLPVGKPSE